MVADADQPKLSRIDQMKRDRIPVQMPPNPAQHLVQYLVEMGMSEAAGMGMVPLSWREINAWCDRTRVDLAPWEARLIRRMSTEYLAEGRRAESENCPPPWKAEVTQRELDVEQARLEMLLG
ncbi:hypothetical protein [Sphingomonas sp. CARO-RG-8B-R24-01]|uniref:phage tail assembly chaperone n=1 Tax=Sphingomonas sp. CARO-RG-8B-R24-01 TaxID=2914831 RepID=UPI001F55E390